MWLRRHRRIIRPWSEKAKTFRTFRNVAKSAQCCLSSLFFWLVPVVHKNALKLKERVSSHLRPWFRKSAQFLFCSLTWPLFSTPLLSLCPPLSSSRMSSPLTLPYPLNFSWPCKTFIPLFHFLLWLIYAIILSSSIRALSLFWRLVNSQLMIYQILITARWKPHSLSWCMVMIAAALLHESQQTLSFIFLFLSRCSFSRLPTASFLLRPCSCEDPSSSKTPLIPL